MDEIAEQFGSKYTLLVHVTMNSAYWGLCWFDERIIELSPSLICYPPLVLTETIIHELTHYQYYAHGKRFYTLMEQNVHKLGLQHELYGWQDKGVRYPTSAIDIAKRIKKETINEFKNSSDSPTRQGLSGNPFSMEHRWNSQRIGSRLQLLPMSTFPRCRVL